MVICLLFSFSSLAAPSGLLSSHVHIVMSTGYGFVPLFWLLSGYAMRIYLSRRHCLHFNSQWWILAMSRLEKNWNIDLVKLKQDVLCILFWGLMKVKILCAIWFLAIDFDKLEWTRILLWMETFIYFMIYIKPTCCLT